MSILLERTKQTQATAQQGLPVLAPGAGTVQWTVVEGAIVTSWQTLGEVRSSFGETVIGCDHAGALAYIVHDGDQVKMGQVIAYVKPPEAPKPRQSARPAPIIAEPAKEQQRPTGEALAPLAPPSPLPIVQEQQEEPTRRSTMPPEVEELEIEEPIQPVKRPKRTKIVKRTCHPTDKQAGKFDELVAQLTKRGFDYSSGELQRVAFHLLLSLSEKDLIREAEANRDREIAGRYGYGARPQG